MPTVKTQDLQETELEKELHEIARIAFLAKYSGRPIAPNIQNRLARCSGFEDDLYIVDVLFYSESDSNAGLTRDLIDPPGQLLVKIKVDPRTRKVTIDELVPVPW